LTKTEQTFCFIDRGFQAALPRGLAMNKRKLLTTLAASTVLSAGLALPAAGDDALTFADEVDSCVALVDRHLDLGQAERVRHFVTNTKRTGIGYAFTIETTVFDSASQRKYAAYCVAQGNNEPVKFSIDELET
jgi:hypothetical protein